jgi:hypothetical protein
VSDWFGVRWVWYQRGLVLNRLKYQKGSESKRFEIIVVFINTMVIAILNISANLNSYGEKHSGMGNRAPGD